MTNIISKFGVLVLAILIILYPSKVGFLFTSIIDAAWNIAVTIGRTVRVPGEKAAIIGPVAGLLFPTLSHRISSINHHLRKER